MTNHFVIATTVKPAIDRRSVIANAVRRAAIRSPFWNITDSFVLCTQNDKPFCHCNYRKTCDWLSLCHCERRKACGNPFPPFGVLRILSCFALRMKNHFVIATTVKPAIGRRSVIASAVRRAAIRFYLN